MVKHSKEFGIYYWDTFDDSVIFINETNTLAEALAIVHVMYKNQISNNGADRVEIVDSKGNVVKSFRVS